MRRRAWPELHEEVDRLPEKYREADRALLPGGPDHRGGGPAARLCPGHDHVAAVTRAGPAAAAAHPPRTGAGFGLLTAGLSADAAKAAVPAALAHSVVQSAMSIAAGTTATGGVSGDCRRPHRRGAEDVGFSRLRGTRGGRPGDRGTCCRDGDACLSDGGSPAARCTSGQTATAAASGVA